MDESSGDRDLVLTLAKGMALLRAYRPGEMHLSNKEFMERTGFSKPTVSRLTKTLVELGYLRFSEQHGRYALGAGVLALGYPLLVSLSIRQAARPLMRELAEAVSGQVSMGIRDRFSMTFIESSRSPNHRLTMPEIGSTIPLLQSAMGRAYLAAMEPEQREKLLVSYRIHRPSEWDRYASELPAVLADYERRGFTCSFGEVRPEAYACAVPLRLRWDNEIIAVNCGVAAHLVGREEMIDNIGPKLVWTARSIEAAAGFWMPTQPIIEHELPRIPQKPRLTKRSGPAHHAGATLKQPPKRNAKG